MSKTTHPYATKIASESIFQIPGAEVSIRSLAEMQEMFADKSALEDILSETNPEMYDVRAVRTPDTDSQMRYCITTLFPGCVGNEFYMTKGHFHAQEADSDELYVFKSGHGIILLQNRDGDTREVSVGPGDFAYIPAGWAHRTINVGEKELIFFSIWPTSTEYDYETIMNENGFRKRVIKVGDTHQVIDNLDRLENVAERKVAE
jgi:glucose-6-phosphate isomerase, archaeal